MALDFSKLKFDISKVPDDQLIIDHFPELKEYKEFKGEYEDAINRWVFLTVDDNSPFFKMHRDFKDRGMAVYNHLSINNKNLLAYIDKSMKKNDFTIKVNAKIYKFFILIGKHNYTAWYSVWKNFQEINAFLQISLDVLDDDYERKFEKRQNVAAKLPGIQKQLSDYEKVIFGDTEIKSIVNDEVAKLIQWPEKMAKVWPMQG